LTILSPRSYTAASFFFRKSRNLHDLHSRSTGVIRDFAKVRVNQLPQLQSNSSSSISSIRSRFRLSHHVGAPLHRSRHTHALHLAAHTHRTGSAHRGRALPRRAAHTSRSVLAFRGEISSSTDIQAFSSLFAGATIISCATVSAAAYMHIPAS
jgi:hypothetical protein